jgi:uridine kinase
MNEPSTGKRPCQVVAIAAPIGGGKSALVTALCSELDGSVALRFDDFETATRQSVEQLAAWLNAGADFAALEAPGLKKQLASLRASGASYVIFEMPLGRAWPATRHAIDLLVWIDVPLDIALARRMLEMSSRQSADLAWMQHYLSHYISTIHGVLEAQRQAVQPQADLRVDGRVEIPLLVRQVTQWLEQNGSAHGHS